MNERPDDQETPESEPADSVEEAALAMDVSMLVRIRDGLERL